jgi:broad specificity phosphatase PhoE
MGGDTGVNASVATTDACGAGTVGEMMTKTTVYLVRHGETDWNLVRRYQGTTDIPLNETGEQQAAQLAAYLHTHELAPAGDAIVSSPLIRAFVTARAIGDALGITEILTDEDLMERAYGVAEGSTLAEREAKWPGANWEGLESWDHVAERGIRAIDAIVARYPGKHVFAVCHGGLINAILTVLTDGELGTGKTVIINTSITTLVHDGSGWTIESVNQTPHLDLEPAGRD